MERRDGDRGVGGEGKTKGKKGERKRKGHFDI